MKRYILIGTALFFASLMLATPLLAMDSVVIERGQQEISEPLNTGEALKANEEMESSLELARQATK
ncbi:hypothetical protein [Halomonas elongata]|uniref:hypothetical protein n=1 Tax=Halomonas elongata TaxID=2746 RepID=UPI0023B206B6|nr:hypothetical protein [Halomonas elongata]